MTTTCAIRVAGHLDRHWSQRLGGLAIVHNGDGTSTLTGPVSDQAQLHGMLAGLRDIGATLLCLRTSGPAGPPVLPRPLRTARLVLRPARTEDADATWRYRRLDAAGAWLTDRPSTVDGHRDRFTEPGRLARTIVVQRGAGVIGDLMLRPAGAPECAVQAELGWVLDPAYHGYASEAVGELIRYGLEDLGLRRVTATCFLADVTSWRLMERVGMRREAHQVRESLHRTGRWLDTVTYALLADEQRPRHADP